MEHWIWRGLEHSSSVDRVVFSSYLWLAQIQCLLLPPSPQAWHGDTASCCKFRLLTNRLANHTGVMLVSTIGTSQTSQTLIVGPVWSRGTDKWGNFTRPIYECVSTSLSLARTLIRRSDKDPWQTVHIHPDCPCPPIAELQSWATKTDIMSYQDRPMSYQTHPIYAFKG